MEGRGFNPAKTERGVERAPLRCVFRGMQSFGPLCVSFQFWSMIASQKSSPLPGTRPPGTSSEREAAVRVREMFTRIAPRYDFLNHLLSFSLDRIWRRRTAKRFLHILRRPDARVLDLCCGTGDLGFALDRARSEGRGFNP